MHFHAGLSEAVTLEQRGMVGLIDWQSPKVAVVKETRKIPEGVKRVHGVLPNHRIEY